MPSSSASLLVLQSCTTVVEADRRRDDLLARSSADTFFVNVTACDAAADTPTAASSSGASTRTSTLWVMLLTVLSITRTVAPVLPSPPATVFSIMLTLTSDGVPLSITLRPMLVSGTPRNEAALPLNEASSNRREGESTAAALIPDSAAWFAPCVPTPSLVAAFAARACLARCSAADRQVTCSGAPAAMRYSSSSSWKGTSIESIAVVSGAGGPCAVPEELESGVGMEPGTFLPLSLLDRLIIWDRIDAAISRRRLFRKHDSGVHTRQKTTNAMVTLKRLSSAVAPSTLS
eukprot:2735726-Prymnesium_polylepis.1